MSILVRLIYDSTFIANEAYITFKSKLEQV